MKKYCEICGKEVETKVVSKKETYIVHDEPIEVLAQVLVCSECGEELFCEELDSATLNCAYNEYRRNHKLLFPDEIKKIREQYGLSQRSFAKLLSWGDKTIHRYENGFIQDKAHNSLLRLLRDPENMRVYLTENEVLLDEKQRKELLATIDRLELNSGTGDNPRILGHFFSKIPSEENGFKGFDYEKLCAMVLFYANKPYELLKTKLMKLLNYADMIFFRDNGISISGLKYVHLPYGPVPDHFDILIDAMTADRVAHIEVLYDNGYEKHRVIPDRKNDKGTLSDAEIEILERVYNRFKDYGSAQISEYSHKEKGYNSTVQGETISYKYAKDMQLA